MIRVEKMIKKMERDEIVIKRNVKKKKNSERKNKNSVQRNPGGKYIIDAL